MAPITQLAVLGLASAVLAVPHAHNHKRDAHPGAPPAYGDSPPVYGASSSAAAVSSSAPAVYGSSSSAAAVSSSAPAVYGSSSSAAAVSSSGSAPAGYGSSSASAPAGYGSSSSAGAVSSSGVPSYSFSGSVSSGYAGPTGGYAHPTGSYSLSTGYVHPTGSYSGPASYSTCTETSTLIFRSSTEYSTYYVTHTIYPGGSSTDAASVSASGPGGYPAPSGGAGGDPSVSAPVSPAGSGSPGAPDGACVPDVTVTTTEKSTIYVTVGDPTGGAPAPSGGYPGSWGPSPSPSSPAATTPASEAPAPSGGYPGSWEPAPSASASPSGGYSAVPSSAPAAPSSAPAAPSSAPAVPSSYPSASTSAAPAPSSSSPPSYGGGASGYSGKRGLNYNDASLTNMFTGSSHVGWAMNWGSDSDGLDPSIPYIPTMWGTDSMWTSVWDANAEAAIKNGAKWFFGFNEPDMPTQANLSPAAAADAWRQYMEPYAGRVKLVAPAVTSGVGDGIGVSWLTSFLEACSDCTIDAVGQHWYNSDGNLVDNFKEHVTGASEAAGGKPVWVNEFGAIGTDAEKSEFLEEVMAWMDSNDSVMGYGYFMVSDGLLCNGDSPSPYGETYMNYSG